jgi:peptide/nickel transport system substrate-binding protein
VVEQIGSYGGTWRAGLVGGSDSIWLQRTIGYENLVRWNPE